MQDTNLYLNSVIQNVLKETKRIEDPVLIDCGLKISISRGFG
jgi:hypothetical protein